MHPETARLVIRSFVPADGAGMLEVFADPEVREQEHGHGLWPSSERTDGT